MTPYYMHLTADESNQVFTALQRAMYLVKQHGTDEEIARFTAAYELMGNHPMSGGYESQAERDAAYIGSFADECAMFGAD